MTWFFIALIGYTAQSVVFLLDKIILSRSLGKPIVYTFYSTIYFFAVLLAVPFGVEFLASGFDWLVASVSGVAFGFGLWTMFIAVKKGEASHINPFIGAVITVCTYVLSGLFLSENITSVQVTGIAILILASLLLSFEKSKKHSGFHMGFLWAIMSGLFFAASHVSAKYIYDLYPFITGFVWTRATTGLLGLAVLAFPSVRNALTAKRRNAKTYEKRHAFGIVVVDKLFALVAIIAVQYAISLGSVTLVNAMSGIQFVLLFIIIFISTKISPKIFKEYFTRSELATETIAVVLVVFGSALFVL